MGDTQILAHPLIPPGGVHKDGTSRIQVLFGREENPLLWDVLTLLDTEYGHIALLNTSFNCSGEPIVHTLREVGPFLAQHLERLRD